VGRRLQVHIRKKREVYCEVASEPVPGVKKSQKKSPTNQVKRKER